VRNRVPWMIRTGAARCIITPSETIRSEVIRFFRVDPRRVTAIPLAAAAGFRPQPLRPQPLSSSRPYFLYAGMLEPRKNVAQVISAWQILRARCDVDLVLAGPHRDDSAKVPPIPGLHRLGVVSEQELAALYSGAIALVYPSLYEGFGLPVLEAMQCGTPVIISTDPALAETAGDAGMREGTLGGMAQAMQALMEDQSLRAEMRARSLKRAAQFTWERTARATHHVYRSMLAR
jgi:glycosyltransferase involved in cell wall biosynthesis